MGRRDPQNAEKELVRRARQGEQQALAELFSKFRAPIYRLCLQRLGDPMLAEDVLQEAFIRARASLARFDPTRSFFPWLASIALNQAADVWHRHERLRPAGLTIDEPQSHQTDSTWEQMLLVCERDRLRQALATLSPKQRRVLLLHDLDGLSYSTVARVEGTSELAARSLVCRARASMRDLLRTLGIVVFGSWRRLVGGRHKGTRAEVVAPLGTVALSVLAAVAALTLIVHNGQASLPAGGASPRSMAKVELGAGASSVHVAAAKRFSIVEVTTTRVRPPALGWQGHLSPARKGAVMPPNGSLTVQVVSPDGSVVYSNQTWFNCRDTRYLPPRFPLRTTC